MALNYAGYNPYPTPQFNTGVTYSPTNSFIWVQGEAGAKSYPVAPGNRIALFDSENPVVYIKSVDVTGKPTEMEIYDLVKREPKPKEEPKTVDLTNYITREEFSSLIAASVSKEVDKAISGLSLKPASKKKKGDDE